MTECLRVETCIAGGANQELPAGLAADHRGDVRAVVFGPAQLRPAGLAAPVLDPFEHAHGRSGGRVGAGQVPGLGHLLSEQEPGAQHIEGVPPALPVDGLGHPVDRLGVGVRDGVVEVGQYLGAPVLHGRQEPLEVRLQHVRHGRRVGVEGFHGLLLGQVVDVVERLLEPVGRRQLGLVVQPHVQVEPGLRPQLGVPHVQGRLGLEPLPPLARLALLLEPDAHPLHAVAGRPHDVELVHHDRPPREHLLGQVAVRAPHVHGHPLHQLSVLEAVQPACHRHLVPVRQHVDEPPLPNVRDDAAHLPVDLGLVDAQPVRHGRPVVGLQAGDVLPGQVPDRLVVAAHILRNANEGIPQAVGLDEGGAPLGHAPVGQDAPQRLQEGLPAASALVPPHLGPQAGRRPTERSVQVGGLLGAVPVQVADGAALEAVGRLGRVLGLQHVHPVLLVAIQDGPAVQVEDVGHPRIVVWNHLREAEAGRAAVSEQDAVGVRQVGLVQRHAVGVQEYVRVVGAQFVVQRHRLLPLRRPQPNLAPLGLRVVGAVDAGRPGWPRPAHGLDQRHAVATVHPGFDEGVSVRPLGRPGDLDPLLLVHADAQPEVHRLHPLGVDPALDDLPLPVGAAEVRQLADLAALRGEGWHQERVPVLAAVQVPALELALADPMQRHAHRGERRGDDLVHVLPGRGLLPLGIHDDGQVRPQLPLNYQGRNPSRLHTPARRPNLCSSHARFPHENPTYEDTLSCQFPQVIPESQKTRVCE